MQDIIGLVGKPIEQLTPAELAQFGSKLAEMAKKVNEYQLAIKEAAEADAFNEIARIAVDKMVNVLGWAKLPTLTLAPKEDDQGQQVYKVAYQVIKVKGTGKKGNGGTRTNVGVNGGKITLNKISMAFGGVAWYRLPDGREFESALDVIKALGKKCYEIDGVRDSYSAILTKEHGDITLVLQNGEEITIADAVARLKAARGEVEAAPEAVVGA